MPNKQIVAPYLDELSKEARLCGSVNCVYNENGKLIGYNTDGHGFVETLRSNGVKIEGAKMTLIGNRRRQCSRLYAGCLGWNERNLTVRN